MQCCAPCRHTLFHIDMLSCWCCFGYLFQLNFMLRSTLFASFWLVLACCSSCWKYSCIFFLVYHFILILSFVKNHNQSLIKKFWMTIIAPLNHCIRCNILKRISSKFKVISNAFVWHEYTNVTKRKGNTNAKTIDNEIMWLSNFCRTS